MQIGIDIGGTKIAAGLVSNGKVLRKLQAPTGKTRAAVMKQLRDMVAEVSRGKRYPIGVGVPGSYKGEKLLIMPNVPWIDGLDLGKALGRPVKLENDSRCFALAEHHHGAGKGSSSMIGMIVGTGFGSGIIIDGKLHRGNRGIAGEIGHGITDLKTKNYSFASIKGDWCTLLSGPGIMRRHKERGGKEQTLLELWTSRTAAAKATREETVRMLAIFLASMQYIIDPQVVVLGGGVTTHIPIVKEVNKILPRYGGVPVRQCKLDAGIIGASLLARPSSAK
jgi:predicted NBD/HSP70 family sugar kinase